jgi:hypothetical protein
LDDRPDLFVRELIAESDHSRPGNPILDHPEHFTFAPMVPKPMMMKISGARTQRGRKRSIACPALTMTGHARSLAFIKRFSFGLDLSGRRKGTRQGSGLSQLVDWDSRLHDVLLHRSGDRQASTS